MFRSLDHPQGAHLVPCQSYMLRVNYFIKCFGDAAAYRLYVYILYLLQGGRPASLQQIQHIHIQTICCRITETFNKIINS